MGSVIKKIFGGTIEVFKSIFYGSLIYLALAAFCIAAMFVLFWLIRDLSGTNNVSTIKEAKTSDYQCKNITVEEARKKVELLSEVKKFLEENKHLTAHASVMGSATSEDDPYHMVKVGNLAPPENPTIFSTHSWYYVDKCSGEVQKQ